MSPGSNRLPAYSRLLLKLARGGKIHDERFTLGSGLGIKMRKPDLGEDASLKLDMMGDSPTTQDDATTVAPQYMDEDIDWN